MRAAQLKLIGKIHSGLGCLREGVRHHHAETIDDLLVGLGKEGDVIVYARTDQRIDLAKGRVDQAIFEQTAIEIRSDVGRTGASGMASRGIWGTHDVGGSSRRR